MSPLRNSERSYRRLFESAEDGILILDADSGRITDANPFLLELIGFSLEEVMGKTVGELSPFKDIMPNQRILERLQAEGYVRYSDLPLETRDGRRIAVEFVSNVYEVGDQRVIQCNIRDITERKRAGQKIHEQGELLNAANETIVVAGLDNRISFWNHGAQRLLGWTAEEMLGKPLNDAFALGGVGSRSPVHPALATIGDWRGEIHGYKRGGAPLVMETSITVLRDEAGLPTGRLSISTDITEKKKLAEQFLRAQRLEAIWALSSGIAHDLNNILAPILLLAPMLRAKLPDPGDGALLEMVEQSAHRGSTIIRQLLTFTRGIEGERVPVAVKHLLREMAGIMRETFPRDIALATDVAADLLPVMADATQIHQVLMNLCVNARDAMPAGGRLTLAARNLHLSEPAAALVPQAKAGCYVVLTVGDTGTGIAPEMLGQIFEPFFTTKEIGKGTGLGLSTVLGIVKSHGGFVSVDSAIGRGTEFHVHLPGISKPDTSLPPTEVAAAPGGKNELVLVVDDEVSIRTPLRIVLEFHGYRVLTAVDGKEALEVLRAHPAEVRLVITDLMMPVMGGLALIRAAQALEPGLKFVAMTGLGDTERREELASIGVAEMVQKPCGPQEILAALRRQLPEGV